MALQDGEVTQRHMWRGRARLPRRMAGLAQHQRAIQCLKLRRLGILSRRARPAGEHAHQQKHSRQQAREGSHGVSLRAAKVERKAFFFEKKKQKTFNYCVRCRDTAQ
jgi:hypothetical protein